MCCFAKFFLSTFIFFYSLSVSFLPCCPFSFHILLHLSLLLSCHSSIFSYLSVVCVCVCACRMIVSLAVGLLLGKVAYYMALVWTSTALAYFLVSSL